MQKAFPKAFLADRAKHLANKLTATRKAAERETLLPAARMYKLLILLPQIDMARERLRKGTYGYCVDCSEPIPEARLLKHPHVERCVPCQKLREAPKRVL